MDAKLGFRSIDQARSRSTKTHPGERLVDQSEWRVITRQLQLTRREGQVVQLLFEGKTKEAAARKMEIRPRTVRQYVEQIYQKLEIQDRVGLALTVIECRDTLRYKKA